MNNIERNKSIYNTFNRAKPWLFYIALFLVLRYTGVISAVSSVTQSALLKSGVMDARPEMNAGGKKFNYDFSIQDTNRNKLDVSSLKGKTIFINVWATWCGPCRAEMSSIQTLYDNIDHEKVAFIILSLDQKDPFQKVSAYIREKGFTFPVYLPAGSLPEQLQVKSIPATFVINKEGKIVFRELGAANYGTEEFQKFLMDL